jgi:hypothetical protein
MTSRISAALLLFSLLYLSGIAQSFPPKHYPQGYFGWPVNAKKALVANFGELRPNHFHMGLDCRTDQRENLPVLAAADGYIAKVKIEPFGFGRCIYINHPNGLTTLYAHLNEFNPVIEKYVSGRQYALESWKVFLDIPAGLLPVKKGQFIAFSGNTGGSQGPHVHFEIRDTQTDKVLNPLLFGFPITDNIPPDILRLAVYDRTISSFEQTPGFYQLRKINGVYTTVPRLLLSGSAAVSFAITAYDRYSGSTNKNGIYGAMLFEDSRPVCGFELDSISYDETRYLNAHIDYRLKAMGGSYVQHLSQLPGYTKGVYQQPGGDGVIDISDDRIHQLRIEVKDARGNASVLAFDIQKTSASPQRLPGELDEREFRPGYVNVFENSSLSFYLPPDALYDALRFRYQEIIPARGKTVYQLHEGSIPVHSYFPVRIKDPGAARPDKMVMHQFWKDRHDYQKAMPVSLGDEQGWYEARFRAFGNYQLIEDTTAPSITPVGFRDGMHAAKLNRIAFVIKDDTEELENFRALLDGKWIRFSNDKGRTFIYKFDEHCSPGEHLLQVSVEDCVGNRAERTYRFTR